MIWQSIATAPVDGTVFIALSPRGVSRCRWIAVDQTDDVQSQLLFWWDDPDGNVFFEDGPNDAPTHWVPEPISHERLKKVWG